MKVKVTIGWLQDKMHKTVEHHMKNMTYGSKVEYIKTGMFTKETVNTPYTDIHEYWEGGMKNIYPWNEMYSVWLAIAHGHSSHEVIISAEAYGCICYACSEKE